MIYKNMGGSECSNIGPYSAKNEEKDGNQGKNYAHKLDGGSSSNSTVEENENRPPVRPYVRSKMPRLRWTPDLQLRFIQAVERLGGQDRATPKLILQLMNIKGLNIAHVKSHLQMYRSKKIDHPSQGIIGHSGPLEGSDQNVYNLSQLAMFPGFNLTCNRFTFRYGDVSWNGLEDLMQFSTMGHSFNKIKPGFYGTFTESNDDFGSRNHNHCPVLQIMNGQANKLQYQMQSESKEVQLFKSSKQIQNLKSSSSNKSIITWEIGSNSSVSVEKLSTAIKRKASDSNIQMNLSLDIGGSSCDGYYQESLDNYEDDERDLSLSLCSPFFSKRRMLVEESSRENASGASTLDLIL